MPIEKAGLIDSAYWPSQRIRVGFATGYAAANLALVRRLAGSALQREPSIKRGIAIRRMRAA